MISLAAIAAAALAVGFVVATALQPSPAHHRGQAVAVQRPAPAKHARRRRAPRPRIVRGSHRRPVPVLAYHVIAAPKPGAPFSGLYVPPRLLRAQLRALARAGYHGVTLGQVFDYWRRGYALPHKPVVVSFDDGYLSDYTRAAPLLRRLSWPGVLNLELGNVRKRGGLTARMVHALIAAGWEVDSHTLTHPDMTTIGAARARHELVGSRAEIKRRFGVMARFFCYPVGRYNASVEAEVKAAGYDGATTEREGSATPADPFALARVRVGPTTSPPALVAQLAALSPG